MQQLAEHEGQHELLHQRDDGVRRPGLAAGTGQQGQQRRVMKMPNRLDAAALHTAAATLPRAIAVKAIEACNGRRQRAQEQDGRAPRSARGSAPPPSARRSPAAGRSRAQGEDGDMQPPMLHPSITASRGSRAPCRKNSRPNCGLRQEFHDLGNGPPAGQTGCERHRPQQGHGEFVGRNWARRGIVNHPSGQCAYDLANPALIV